MYNQQGNAMLFVLLCVPVVLSFAILVIDVSRYQSTRESVREFADKAVLDAARFLPNQLAVKSLIEDKINSQQQYFLADLKMTAASVSLTIDSRVDSLFDFFIASATGKKQSFSLREQASALVSPLDLVLIMPDGRTLRPAVGENWGAASDWPASTYFNFVSAPTLSNQSQAEYVWPEWWKQFGADTYRRWTTQSCYNPVYSAVKSFVISLQDTFSAFANSRIAVIAVPGEDPLLGYSLLSPINQELADNKLSYWENENYLSDELCVLMADRRYSIFNNIQSSCDALLTSNGTGNIFYPRALLSDCVKEGGLSSRETVYYHSATKNMLRADRSDILASIKTALSQIASQPKIEMLEARANLLTSPRREIILLTDVVAFDPSLIADFWTNAGGEQLNARLNIVPILSPAFAEHSEVEQFSNSLRELNLPWLNVFTPRNPEDLVEVALPEIIQQNQQILLKE